MLPTTDQIQTTSPSQSVTVPTREKTGSNNTGYINWLPVRLVTWSCTAIKYLLCEAKEYFHSPAKRLEDRKINTVFIGAGPVGLWTAVQHKLNNPDADIQVFEKHSTYSRKHTVRVDLNSFKGAVLNPELNELKARIKKNRHHRISCLDLETSLLKIAQDLGITINKDSAEVTEVNSSSITLKDGKTVQYDQLVCADGAHSKMRKAMNTPEFQTGETINIKELPKDDHNDEFSMRREIQHRARVSYKVKGDTPRMNGCWSNWIKYYYPISKWFGSPIDEQVGPLVDGERTVTIDFFVTEKEYEALYQNGKGFNLSKPAGINDLPASLREKILKWQTVKGLYLGEKISNAEVQATPYALMYFQAKKVATVNLKGKPVYLVGDAATSLPYFRSLNNGLKCGNALGATLANGDKKPHRAKALTENYERLSDLRARKEFVVARLKDRAINLVKGFLWLSHRLPRQLAVLPRAAVGG